MKTQIKFNGNKSLVVIQTPITSTSFTQVTCLMSDEEFEEAKKERPDLIFRKASDLPLNEEGIEAAWNGASKIDSILPVEKMALREGIPVVTEAEDVTKGITVKGMTLPHNLDDLINQLFEKE